MKFTATQGYTIHITILGENWYEPIHAKDYLPFNDTDPIDFDYTEDCDKTESVQCCMVNNDNSSFFVAFMCKYRIHKHIYPVLAWCCLQSNPRQL